VRPASLASSLKTRLSSCASFGDVGALRQRRQAQVVSLLSLAFSSRTLDLAVLTTIMAAESKKKWSGCTGKDSSACQERFNDLGRLLSQPFSAQGNPSGPDSFCFPKRAVKPRQRKHNP